MSKADFSPRSAVAECTDPGAPSLHPATSAIAAVLDHVTPVTSAATRDRYIDIGRLPWKGPSNPGRIMSMSKATWSEVVSKTKARRKAGDDVEQNMLSKVQAMDSTVKIGAVKNILKDHTIYGLIDEMGTTNNQATLAFGILFSTAGIHGVFLVNKGGKAEFRQSFSEALSAACNKISASTDIIDVGNPESGLHAEMAIIRAVAAKYPSISKHDIGKYLAVVCVGKQVCMDCAGWMNSHKIGHCSFLPDPPHIEYGCGNVSTMMGGTWRHPLTNSAYSGGNNLASWQSGKVAKSLSIYS